MRTTARIGVGEDALGRDVEVYVTSGCDHDEQPKVVIAISDGDPTDPWTWNVLSLADPFVVRRLADTLPAAALVLEQLQNGDLP
jgi:hypothetical protein